MLRFNNLSISAKLGITSGIGILLALGMIATLIHSNGHQQAVIDQVNHEHVVIEETFGCLYQPKNFRKRSIISTPAKSRATSFYSL
jgi:hypothetical protein